MTAKAADLLSLPMSRVAVVLVVSRTTSAVLMVAGEIRTRPTSTTNEQHSWPPTSPAKQQHWAPTSSTPSRCWTGTRCPPASNDGRHLPVSALPPVGGAELYLEPVPGSVTVVKHRFDCWQSPDFVRELEHRDIDGLIICGVELVCCVLYAILDADERGYHYLVPTDLVSGRDTGDETDNKAVREYLRHNQPEHLTTAEQLLTSWRA